jgi:hypothetical protein
VGRIRLLIPLVSPKDLFHSPQPSKEALGYIYRCHQGLTWLAKHNIGVKLEISNTKLLVLLLTKVALGHVWVLHVWSSL